jgi:TPR repeat protein
MPPAGRMNEHGTGKRRNADKAFQWYRAAAELGSAKGQNALGHCYYRGIGTPQDAFQAVEAFKASAQAVGLSFARGAFDVRLPYPSPPLPRNAPKPAQGYPAAFNNLGIMYEEGNGVIPSNSTAKHYYKLAADGQYPGGINNYGYMCLLERDYWTALEYFQLARSHKIPDAAYNLGMLHETGCADDKGVLMQPDLELALRYYREAATHQGTGRLEGGYVKAQIRLASLLVAERPGEESFQEAEALLLAAMADEADCAATDKRPDPLRPSATPSPFQSGHGSAEARNLLGELYELGVCDSLAHQPNLERAIELYREATRQGHARATFNLAAHYESGRVLEPDMEMAVSLYAEAHRRGNADATERLTELRRAGCIE